MTISAAAGNAPRVHILGAACALGAPHAGSAHAPSALRSAQLMRSLIAAGVDAQWVDTLHPVADTDDAFDMRTRLELNGAFARALANAVAALPAGAFPFVLGGDHAIASGTWRGVGRRLGHAPGLIWIDAHLDSHTALTTHSGNIHGMPLAALLGEGDPALAAIAGPTLDPQRTCVIGARAWEAEERALLQRLGVRVFAMDEVRARGLAAVFCDALNIVRAGAPGFGLSLDLDAIEPSTLPAVTCPEVGGIDPAALVAALRHLRACEDFVALELVEYRPDLDPEGDSAHWIAAFAAAALGPRPERCKSAMKRAPSLCQH